MPSRLWSWWESNPRPDTAFVVVSTCLVILLIVGKELGDNVQGFSVSTEFSSQMPLNSSLLHSYGGWCLCVYMVNGC